MKNEHGLSLIEVLVSMIILAVGLLGLAPLVVMSIESNSMSQDAMTVSNLAKETIETYENAPSLPLLPFENEETGLEGCYNRATRIWDNTVDTLVPSGLCRVEVVISWEDKMGVSRSATYSTLLDKD
ncbi:MAG: prepilin-type N-terminal cleavage/methylation domain-containing protein [Candidatus Zixiibacteriota bacterium]